MPEPPERTDPRETPPDGWPPEWWRAYVELHELWEAGRLDESRALLAHALPRFGHLPTAKLAQGRQLCLEAAPEDRDTRRRARDLVVEAVGPDEHDPDLVMTALLITFDLGDLRQAADYLGRLGPRARELDQRDAAAAMYIGGCLLVHAGRADEAEEHFRDAVEANPEEPLYARALAESRSGSGPAWSATGRSATRGLPVRLSARPRR